MKKIGNATLYCADCKDVLPLLKEIDACVTDPPYGLSFMGKAWDYDVPGTDIWTQVHDVLKPGAHLLSFFGSRTYHRGAIPIEDAGFEIRDQLMWLYGSGFPKSHNIGKAVDKIGGKSLKWFVDYVISYAETKGISKNDLTMLFPSKNGNPTGWLWNKASGTQGLTVEQFNKIKNFLELPFETLQECEREIIGKKQSGLGSGKTYAFTENNMNAKKEIDITKGNSKWEGWGTALKPAHEPIVMARKPFKGSVAENVLEHSTGGINIDECRVQGDDIGGDRKITNRKTRNQDMVWTDKNSGMKNEGTIYADANPAGRYPANVMHDGSEEVQKIFPQTSKSVSTKRNRKTLGSFGMPNDNTAEYDDEGTAARYFYCPKASKEDRDEGLDSFSIKQTTGGGGGIGDYLQDVNSASGKFGSEKAPSKNNHPTVKPTELMQYLCRLVTPKGGVVLDPFMGSGSTGKAAILSDFKFVGIELNEEYFEIACARVERAHKSRAQELF
jgi:DNA modification methylase